MIPPQSTPKRFQQCLLLSFTVPWESMECTLSLYVSASITRPAIQFDCCLTFSNQGKKLSISSLSLCVRVFPFFFFLSPAYLFLSSLSISHMPFCLSLHPCLFLFALFLPLVFPPSTPPPPSLSFALSLSLSFVWVSPYVYSVSVSLFLSLPHSHSASLSSSLSVFFSFVSLCRSCTTTSFLFLLAVSLFLSISLSMCLWGTRQRTRERERERECVCVCMREREREKTLSFLQQERERSWREVKGRVRGQSSENRLWTRFTCLKNYCLLDFISRKDDLFHDL